MKTLSVSGLPVPPSANMLYAYAPSYRRMVKTKYYRSYEREVRAWKLVNDKQIVAMREFFKDIHPSVIHVDAVFYMPKTEIVCKDGRPKKNDTANRLKALHDILSNMIGVDDCYFWSGSFEKKVAESNACVNIIFKLRNIGEQHDGQIGREDQGTPIESNGCTAGNAGSNGGEQT